jgi:hypothetical protein
MVRARRVTFERKVCAVFGTHDERDYVIMVCSEDCKHPTGGFRVVVDPCILPLPNCRQLE